MLSVDYRRFSYCTQTANPHFAVEGLEKEAAAVVVKCATNLCQHTDTHPHTSAEKD